MDLEFPQRLTPLSTCAASQHPSHVSTARLCLPHTQKQVHEHKPQACGRPASIPPWKGCWKVPGPALACTEKGLRAQRGEDPSPRSHSTSGAGPGIKPRSLFSCPVLLSLCSSWPLSPAPSPCLHHVSWGRGLKGMVGPATLRGPCLLPPAHHRTATSWPMGPGSYSQTHNLG